MRTPEQDIDTTAKTDTVRYAFAEVVHSPWFWAAEVVVMAFWGAALSSFGAWVAAAGTVLALGLLTIFIILAGPIMGAAVSLPRAALVGGVFFACVAIALGAGIQWRNGDVTTIRSELGAPCSKPEYLAIEGGVIEIGTSGCFAVDTEFQEPEDNIDRIKCTPGDRFTLKSVNNSRTVIINEAPGIGSGFSLNCTSDRVSFECDSEARAVIGNRANNC